MTDKDLIASVRALPNGAVAITALTLYGEGRGVSEKELHGMASAINNRVKAQRKDWGLTAEAVCLDPFAFSCWRAEGGASDYASVLDAARFFLRPDHQFKAAMRRCLSLAESVVSGAIVDSVKASTHYCTLAMFKAKPPFWAEGRPPTIIIGSTVFWAGIR